MALASFGRRCSSPFAKLSTKVSTAPLNSIALMLINIHNLSCHLHFLEINKG